MERERGWYWVCHLQDISILKVNCLIREFGNPEEIMTLTDRELDSLENLTAREKKIIALNRDNREMILESYERLWEQKIRFVSFEQEEYPARLLELEDRPVGLFVKGRLPDRKKPCVSIVGARACSEYGRSCASYFARTLSEAGVQIVSGMAYGVDSTAQKSAVESGGSSFAVLGGGVNICYPKENYELYVSLQEHGGVFSETIPGTAGRAWLFPKRNRIISGIADAVVVVEARERSGSLITANCAAEQGRMVYAVPGRIDSALSRGCHELIRGGAVLLQKPSELLEDLKLTLEAGLSEEFSCKTAALTDQEKDIYSCMEKEPVHIEELLVRTGYPVGTLMHILLQLEIKGYACQNPRNYYRKTRLIPSGV